MNVHVLVQDRRAGGVPPPIADGAADRSYGIHVAQLAGLPRPCSSGRAKCSPSSSASGPSSILDAPAGRKAARAKVDESQLGLFGTAHPVLDELKRIEPDAVTPLEALQKLAEWKKRWGGP